MSKTLVMISGSCCMPWLGVYEKKLENQIVQLIEDNDPEIRFIRLPVTKAMYSGLPETIKTQLMDLHQREGRVPLPAVIYNERLIGHTKIDIDSIAAVISDLKGENYEK